MELDVSDYDKIEVIVAHECDGEETPEPYAAIDGSRDRPGLFLLECENCGNKVPVAVNTPDMKPEMVEVPNIVGRTPTDTGTPC